MPRVIKYFAKSLKRTVGRISLKLCLYPVPFRELQAPNNGVALKSWLSVVQGH